MQDSTLSAAVPIPPVAPSALDQAQFEADKRAVYKHPLFSLLALLLEKCEQATQGYICSAPAPTNNSSHSNSSSPNAANGNCDGDSFSRDVQAFVQMLEKEKRPLLTNDSELDGLMIKALQVLRIHLLELEKVQELCRDFCTRYIACLRGKMQSENLLRADYPLDGSHTNLSNSNSPTQSTEDHIGNSQTGGGYYANNNNSNEYLTSGIGASVGGGGGGGVGDGHDFSNLQVPLNFHNSTAAAAAVAAGGNAQQHLQQQQQSHLDAGANLADNNTITAEAPPASTTTCTSPGQLHQQQQQLHGQHHHHHNNNGSPGVGSGNGVGGASVTTALHSILGSTPLSQIGVPLNLDQFSGQLSPCGSSGDELDSDGDSNNDDIGSNFSNSNSSKRQKRGILPKHATSVMRAWLFQHLVHPYPTEDEKRTIAAQTNLTLLQVNNWFINARRRILQPMLDHADNSRKKQSSMSPPGSASNGSNGTGGGGGGGGKRFWADSTSAAAAALMIDPNIENISANMNRVDSERLLAAATKKLAAAAEGYFSSEESNDNESLVIDQENV